MVPAAVGVSCGGDWRIPDEAEVESELVCCEEGNESSGKPGEEAVCWRAESSGNGGADDMLVSA